MVLGTVRQLLAAVLSCAAASGFVVYSSSFCNLCALFCFTDLLLLLVLLLCCFVCAAQIFS
jgi:hypothetical protein